MLGPARSTDRRRRLAVRPGGLFLLFALAAGFLTFGYVHRRAVRKDLVRFLTFRAAGPFVIARQRPVETPGAPQTRSIRWSTGGAGYGEVYVTRRGQPDLLIGVGPEGLAEVVNPRTGQTCDVRLYEGTDRRRLLAEVAVAGEGKSPRDIFADGVWFSALSTLLVALVPAALARSVGRERLARVLLGGVALWLILDACGNLLREKPLPLARQPAPDAQEYADGARQLASGKGYVTCLYSPEPKPLRYPPGYSLALMPFALRGDFPENVRHGAAFYTLLFLLTACAVAWHLGGPLAAALAGLCLGHSPFARAFSAMILSEPLAASFPLAILGLLRRPGRGRVALAALLAGISATVRLNMVATLPALVLALPRGSRRRMVWALPPLAALALYHWTALGSPFRTGYHYWLPGMRSFSAKFATCPRDEGSPAGSMTDGPWIVGDLLQGNLVRSVFPTIPGDPQQGPSNLVFYSLGVLGLFWVFAPPLVPAVGLLSLARARRTVALGFARWFVGLTLVLHLFYFYQAFRFLAPPVAVLTVLACALAARTVDRLTSVRGAAPPRSTAPVKAVHPRLAA